MNIQQLTELTEQYAKVHNIVKIINDDMVDGVIVYLNNQTAIIVSVDVDTDELKIIINQSAISPLNAISILPKVQGLILIRTWVMQNHKGYQDAIQFEFFDKECGDTHFVQLMAISSEIVVYAFGG